MTENKKEKMISVGDLFNKSFAVYKTVFWAVIKMLLAPWLALIPVGIIAFLGALVYFFVNNDNIANGLYLVLVVLGVAAILFFIVVMYIARIAANIIVQHNNPKLTFKEAFMMAKAKAWTFLGTSLLATLFIFLWTLLLVIPGIIMGIYYAFVTWMVLEENLSGSQALKRSKSLVKGYWWAVFGRLILPSSVLLVALGILSFFMVAEDGTGQSSYDLISQIISLAATPFFIAYSYNIYKSLRAIKDKV